MTKPVRTSAWSSQTSTLIAAAEALTRHPLRGCARARGSRRRGGACRELAAQRLHPFPQPGQAPASREVRAVLTRGGAPGSAALRPGGDDLDLRPVGGVREAYQRLSTRGVLHGVRQGFLHDAVGREPGTRGYGGLFPVLDQLDGLAARARLLHQVGHPARRGRPGRGSASPVASSTPSRNRSSASARRPVPLMVSRAPR